MKLELSFIALYLVWRSPRRQAGVSVEAAKAKASAKPAAKVTPATSRGLR